MQSRQQEEKPGICFVPEGNQPADRHRGTGGLRRENPEMVQLTLALPVTCLYYEYTVQLHGIQSGRHCRHPVSAGPPQVLESSHMPAKATQVALFVTFPTSVFCVNAVINSELDSVNPTCSSVKQPARQSVNTAAIKFTQAQRCIGTLAACNNPWASWPRAAKPTGTHFSSHCPTVPLTVRPPSQICEGCSGTEERLLAYPMHSCASGL
jgi:hypothetical protein